MQSAHPMWTMAMLLASHIRVLPFFSVKYVGSLRQKGLFAMSLRRRARITNWLACTLTENV
eukprot:10671459-Karenia_brevis.AAC.1